MSRTLSGRGGRQRNVTFVEEMVLAMTEVRKTKTVLLEAMLGGDWGGGFGLCALRQGMTFRVFIVKWGQYRHLLPRGTAMRWHSWGTSEAHVNGSSHNTTAILSNAETFNEADVQECDGRRPRKLGGKGGWRPDNNEP